MLVLIPFDCALFTIVTLPPSKSTNEYGIDVDWKSNGNSGNGFSPPPPINFMSSK